MKNLAHTFRRFYAYETQYKAFFVTLLVFVVLSSILDSILPYFYKLFVDNLESLDFSMLFNLLLIYVGVRVGALLLNTLSYLVGDVVLFRASRDVRIDVFKHIQDLDFAFHTEKSTGSLISAIKRGDGAYFNLHQAIHHRILDVLVGFCVMIYFFSKLSPLVTIAVSISFLLSLVITRFIVGYNVRMRKLFNAEEDKISGIIVDNIINYETVKLFAKESWEFDRLKGAFVPWYKNLWKYGNSFRLFDISIGAIVNSSIFVVLLLTLQKTVTNSLTIGEFVLAVTFVTSFFPRLFDLVFSFRDIAKHYADISKYLGIFDYKIQIKDPVKPVEKESVDGEIVFDHITFLYKDGKKPAVKNIDLRIRQGQSVAFVGRSGSGKTTLVKLLLRFYDVTNGKITIDGISIQDFTKSQLRSFIGVVPQEPILFNNTVAYNISYGKNNASKDEIVAAAKMANLHEFILSMPKKYNTIVGERGVKLSGGQKQRLAIARMILSDPDIVIFDEATSQLDAENEKLISDAFWKATKNKTTIIVAHRLSTAMQADKIVVLENGVIKEIGSHKQLTSTKGSLYRHFWNLQTDNGE